MMVDAPAIHEDAFTVAQGRLAQGQALTQGDETLLDRFMGNGDGAFNQLDRDKITADREDTAMWGGIRATGSAAAEYAIISVGASELKAAPISGIFDNAALGGNVTPASPQLGFNGPTANGFGMSMGMDITMAPRGPSGFGA